MIEIVAQRTMNLRFIVMSSLLHSSVSLLYSLISLKKSGIQQLGGQSRVGNHYGVAVGNGHGGHNYRPDGIKQISLSSEEKRLGAQPKQEDEGIHAEKQTVGRQQNQGKEQVHLGGNHDIRIGI